MKTTVKDETLMVLKYTNNEGKKVFYLRLFPIETERFPKGIGFKTESEDESKIIAFKDDVWNYLEEAFGLKNEIIDYGEGDTNDIPEQPTNAEQPQGEASNLSAKEAKLRADMEERRQQMASLITTPEQLIVSIYLGCKNSQNFLLDVKETTPEKFAKSHLGDVGESVAECMGESIRYTYDLYSPESNLNKYYTAIGVTDPIEMSRLILIDLHNYTTSKFKK